MMARSVGQKMESIDDFLAFKAVPPGLSRRVKNYFDFLWSRQRGINDQEILQEMPYHLRKEVRSDRSAPRIDSTIVRFMCDMCAGVAVFV
jgi:hypothetical protein